MHANEPGQGPGLGLFALAAWVIAYSNWVQPCTLPLRSSSTLALRSFWKQVRASPPVSLPMALVTLVTGLKPQTLSSTATTSHLAERLCGTKGSHKLVVMSQRVGTACLARVSLWHHPSSSELLRGRVVWVDVAAGPRLPGSNFASSPS